MSVGDRTRWLRRVGGEDHGPFSSTEMLGAIEAGEMDLGTLICDVATQNWEPAGVHPVFRDHYARCTADNEARDLISGAESHERKLKRDGAAKSVIRWLLLASVFTGIGFGGWELWRVLTSEPADIANAVTLPRLPLLPALPGVKASISPPPLLAPRRVTRRVERAQRRHQEALDVSGVGAEGSGRAPVTHLAFDDDGRSADGLSDSVISRIVANARKGLEGCATTAGARSATFQGTRVTFVVRSARLDSFTVGKTALGDRAFKACVKSVLKKISVPAFEGSERRIRVDLSASR